MSGIPISDLSEMRALVKDWGDRSDISDSIIDSFINITVQRLNKQTKLAALEAIVTIPVVDSLAALPSDYLEAKALFVESGGHTFPLNRKSIQFVESSANKTSNVPCYFARTATDLMLAPTAASVTECELHYWILLDSLVNDTDTNFYLTDGTTATLYGSLKELSVYISDEETESTWEQQFQSAMLELQIVDDKEAWSGDTLAVSV